MEGKKNLNIQIPASLHDHLKNKAYESRCSMTAYITKVLKDSLGKEFSEKK